MPRPEVWLAWALIPALIALFLSWYFYRRYTRTKKLKNLLLSQLFVFPAAFLLIRLLEARGLVAPRVADFLYLAAGAAVLAAGFLLGRTVRRRRRKKPAGRRQAARKTSRKSNTRRSVKKKK